MPFQPGQSGNVKGRPPKTKCITDSVNRALLRHKQGDVQAIEKIGDEIVRIALDPTHKDQLSAMVYIRDTVQGKPAQTIVGDDEEAPVSIAHTFAWLPPSE